MTQLKEEYSAVFCGQVVDLFENFCDQNKITINNPEKEKYDREAGYEPGENAVVIFGADYDYIIAPIEEIAGRNLDKDVVVMTIGDVVRNFCQVMTDNNTPIDLNDFNDLAQQVTDTFIEWELL